MDIISYSLRALPKPVLTYPLTIHQKNIHIALLLIQKQPSKVGMGHKTTLDFRSRHRSITKRVNDYYNLTEKYTYFKKNLSY